MATKYLYKVNNVNLLSSLVVTSSLHTDLLLELRRPQGIESTGYGERLPETLL